MQAMRTTRRAVVLLSAIAVVFALLLTSGVHAEGAGPAAGIHVVQPGESLWTIAAAMTPPGEDLRVAVAELRRVNGLEGSGLTVGQRLQIPLLP